MSAGHERALDRAQHVDDPLRVRLGRADRLEVAAQEMRDDDLPSLQHVRALECPREELELRELNVLVHALGTRGATSAPASTRSAARRSAFGDVFAYWKRPVSVTSAM